MSDATDTMLCWNPGGEVRLIPWPARRRAGGFDFSALACCDDVRSASFRDRQVAVLAEALVAVVRDGCDPGEVHRACMSLDEYRAAMPADIHLSAES